MAGRLVSRPFDFFISLVYGIQVPMALLLDSQSVLPLDWYPAALKDLNEWYIQQYGDPLVGEKPGWFQGITYFEIFVQVPFWAIASYAYAADKQWIRLPGLVFSLCSLTVMVPIISELLLSNKHFDKQGVLQIYAIFVVVPLLTAVKTLLSGELRPAQRVKTA